MIFTTYIFCILMFIATTFASYLPIWLIIPPIILMSLLIVQQIWEKPTGFSRLIHKYEEKALRNEAAYRGLAKKMEKFRIESADHKFSRSRNLVKANQSQDTKLI